MRRGRGTGNFLGGISSHKKEENNRGHYSLRITRFKSFTKDICWVISVVKLQGVEKV